MWFLTHFPLVSLVKAMPKSAVRRARREQREANANANVSRGSTDGPPPGGTLKLKWKATNVVIQPSSSFSLPVSLTQSGSTLKWNFQTLDYDVCFGVIHVDEKGTSTELVPITRCESHQHVCEGFLQIQKVRRARSVCARECPQMLGDWRTMEGESG